MYVVKKEHISFIHAHHYEGAFIGWLVKKIRRDSILIYDCHASLSEEMVQFKFLARYKWMRSWWQCVERFINTHNDFTIAVSEELANTVVEQDGPKEKVAVIPMGVNLEDFANNSVTNEDLRKIHNLGDSRLVMYTGNLSPIQGIENLLSAFSRVAEKLKNVKLVIVGNTELQKYKDLTTTMGLSENVIFTGEKAFDYVPSYLALADVLVSPRTNCPGTPQKLANYMASGKPIVAFKGSAKGLVNEINGLVVENGDIDGFADAIVKTLTDQILATKISEGAKCSAQSLDWPELVKKIDSIYNIELNYV